MCYSHDRQTGVRKSLKTRDASHAQQLIRAMNQSSAQPILNREMAKVFLKGQDPRFCERTWQDVADLTMGGFTSSSA
jgi:hypothetical protein